MHGVFYRLATNLENSGNLKSCQNHREISGNLNLCGQNWKTHGECKKLMCDMYIYIYIPADFSLLSCSGKNF